MAELIPPFFGAGPASERTVFRALERFLPQGWAVWWSLAYSALAGGPDGEGEIDFLCAHPEHGLVAVEVKGGALDCRDGRWFQNGRPLREAPHAQAARHAYALRAILSRRLGAAPLPFPLTHALWLPDADRPPAEPLPLAGITLYADDLPRPGPALLRVLGRRRPGAPIDLGALRAILSPTVAYHPGWALRRTLADARIARLTQEQAHAFDAFSAFPRLRVRGCAGSGKTLLAVRRAAQLARRGRRVLLLCFNLLLAERLRELVADLPTVRALAVNDLLLELLGRADDGSPDFWRRLARDALPAARAFAQRRPCDAVIVDEGQDFSPAVWEAVKALVPPNADFLVFYDPAQNIFQRDLSALPAFPWPEATLTLNCRNTRAVFEALRPYAPDLARPAPDAPPGDAPETYAARNRAALRERLRAILARLIDREAVPSADILLLGAHALPRMGLGTILAERPSLRYYTYRKFKGLEAPILILLDVAPDDPLWDRPALYTAISRAIHKLIVLRLDPGPLTKISQNPHALTQP